MPMAHLDRHDQPLTTASEVAAERYRVGTDLLLSAWPGAAEALDSAIAADPDFALARAARARLQAIRGDVAAARTGIAQAAALAECNGTERERGHVATLSLAIHGQSAPALAQALDHLERWPRDVMIFSLPLGAFGLLAFSGRADHNQARVDLCERHARHFAADDWWFLTYRGWSHGENGDVSLGHTLTARALALRPNNANAAHAAAHVLHEAGAQADAGALLDRWLPSYDRTGILHGHLAWHGALIALARGDTASALATYQASVAPAVNRGLPINVISDTASLLWRLRIYGHGVPDGLWDDAAQYARAYFPQAGFAFADVHMALLAAASGDTAALAQRLDTLDDLVAAGRLPAGPVVPAVCRALQAFCGDDPATCAQLLAPLMSDVARIGGSGAQREVIEDTLLVALMRSGEAATARALLDRRLHRRPSVRDAAWRDQLTGQ